MGIDAVVFDVGGVLCAADPIEEFAKVDSEYRLPAGTVQSLFRGGSLWQQVETGRMPVHEFYRHATAAMLADHGVRVPGGRLDEMLANCMGTNLRRDMLGLVTEIKAAGHRIALLTNIFAERRSWLESLFPPRVVDVICDSSEVGLRKPEPAIYERLLSMLGATAAEVVFVDDFEENVAAARRLGMGGVLFASTAQTREELAGLGVRVGSVAPVTS